MGSPTVLSLPRDRLGRPVTLEYVADVRRAPAVAVARGRRTGRRRAKSARRASFWHAQRDRPECPMYVSKSPVETWEGPLRTHRRTARLSIWQVHFWPWTTRRKLLCIARTPSRWARGPAQQRKRSILLDSRRIKQRSARPSRQTALTSLLRRAALSATPQAPGLGSAPSERAYTTVRPRPCRM